MAYYKNNEYRERFHLISYPSSHILYNVYTSSVKLGDQQYSNWQQWQKKCDGREELNNEIKTEGGKGSDGFCRC